MMSDFNQTSASAPHSPLRPTITVAHAPAADPFLHHPPHQGLRAGDFAPFTTSPIDNMSHGGPFQLESRLMGRAPSLSEDDASSVSSAHSLSQHFDFQGPPGQPLPAGEEANLAHDVAHLLSPGSRRTSSGSDAFSTDSESYDSWDHAPQSHISTDASSASGAYGRGGPAVPISMGQWVDGHYERIKGVQAGIPLPLTETGEGQPDLDPTPHAFSWLQQIPLGTDPLHAAHVYAPAPGTIQFLEDAIPKHEYIDPNMFAPLGHEQQPGQPHAHYHQGPPQQQQQSPAHDWRDQVGAQRGQLQESTDYDYALHYTPAGPGLADWTATLADHENARRASFPPGSAKQGGGPSQGPMMPALTTGPSSRHGRRASVPTIREPLHWQSQTTAATKQAAIARRKPGVEARFACHYCGESFTRAYNLRGHLRAHQGERPYVCDFPGCGKSFARSHDKRRHQDLHSTACKYRCTLCARPFRRLDALNRHHKQESDQPCSTASGRCFAHSEGHCASAIGPRQTSPLDFEQQPGEEQR